MTRLRHPTARRLMLGLGASLLGKAWILVLQLVMVPALTYSWGGAGYGVWIMITAVPTFIGLSDFGLGQAVGVRMTQAVARGDHEDALKAYQSVWVFLTLVTAVVCAVVAVGAIVWQLNQTGPSTGSSPFTSHEIALAIAFSACYAFLALQLSIQRAILQATHKFAISALIIDSLFLINGLAITAIALLKGGIVQAAMAQAFIQMFGLSFAIWLNRRLEPWARQGYKHADMVTLRSLLRPSLGALSLTLSNSFGLQGVVLTIGWFLGPSTAATFTTCRMLTRIPLQFAGMLTRTSIPELVHLKVSGNIRLWRRLVWMNVGASLAIMVPFAIVLSLFGPVILKYMSHGHLIAPNSTFVMLGLAATFCSAWQALGSQLMAENKQSVFGHIALGAYLIGALTPFFFRQDIMPTLLALVLADAAILARVALAVRQSAPNRG